MFLCAFLHPYTFREKIKKTEKKWTKVLTVVPSG